MKKLFLFLIAFTISPIYLLAQAQFTVNGETLVLKVETEGELDLLSYKQENNFRFFIKDKDENIYELLNTKSSHNYYSQEYITVLNTLTKGSNMSTIGVGFGRYSLKQFIKAYNSNGNKRFAYTDDKVKIQSRLGFFGGVTNHPFIENIKNTKTPFFYAELEIFEENENPRQTGFFNIKHALDKDDLKYSATQLILGYRYRFIKKAGFNIYGNLEFATYTFSKRTVERDGYDEILKSSAFRVPIIFGLGADIKVSSSSFITIAHNELFGLFANNSDNFPLDFTLGYKFNL